MNLAKIVKRITIDFEEYEELLRHDRKLEALESAGVENWNGYTDAIETIQTEGMED